MSEITPNDVLLIEEFTREFVKASRQIYKLFH